MRHLGGGAFAGTARGCRPAKYLIAIMPRRGHTTIAAPLAAMYVPEVQAIESWARQV